MLRCSILLTCFLLAIALSAEACQNQSPATDQHGDPLPPGAVARAGSLHLRHDGIVRFASFTPPEDFLPCVA
jgi:hypothetical protein